MCSAYETENEDALKNDIPKPLRRIKSLTSILLIYRYRTKVYRDASLPSSSYRDIDFPLPSKTLP